MFPTGKPQPLVYHVPQEFFNALQHRLSLGSKKRRLPNFTTGDIYYKKAIFSIPGPLQVLQVCVLHPIPTS